MGRKPETKTRDAEATRQAILDAAEIEFARAGLLGARTENIAERTGVTRAMIHYYYDSKENLYQAVLERAFAARLRTTQQIDLHAENVEEALVQYLESFIKDSVAHPNFISILLFEAVQNDGRFYKNIAMTAIYEPLVNLLRRGINSGVFRKMCPLHAAINIIGTAIFYFSLRNNLKHLFPPGTDLLDPEMAGIHLRESIAMTLIGIRSTGDPASIHVFDCVKKDL